MRKSQVIGVAVVGVAIVVAGAFLLVRTPPQSRCEADAQKYCQGTNGPCRLPVKVTSCAADGSGIAVPEELSVCTSRDIVWELDGKDANGKKYKFADKGIDFKQDYTPVFDPTTKVKGPYKYQWTDKHQPPPPSGTAYYPYTVNVVKDDDSPCAAKDPRISNE